MIYLFNPWMTNRLVHFFLFFGSFTIPIVFSLSMRIFFDKGNSMLKILLLPLLIAVTSATPHVVMFDLLIIVCIASLSLVKNKNILRLSKILTTLGILTLLFSSFWILPYLSAGAIPPDRAESIDILMLLSQNASFSETLRLMSYWWFDTANYFVNNQFVAVIQLIISFVLPLLTGIYLFKNRKSLLPQLFTVIGSISLFLASLTPISYIFYKWLLFDSPINSFGWLFREIDKFGIILAYIFSISITLFLISNIRNLKTYMVIVSLSFVYLMFVFPHYNFVMKQYFTPTQIPADFTMVNDFLSKDETLSNVVWYPPVNEPTWSNSNDNPYSLTQLSTVKPVFNLTSRSKYIVEFLFNSSQLQTVDLAKSLDLLGVKYVVIRDDDPTYSQQKLLRRLEQNPQLVNVYTTDFLTIFENTQFSNYTKRSESMLISNAGLDTLKYLDELNIDTNAENILYTDTLSASSIDLSSERVFYLLEAGDTNDLIFSQFFDQMIFPFDYTNRAQPHEAWAKGSLTDLTHAESHFFLNQNGIHNSQFDYDKGIIFAFDNFQLTKQRVLEMQPRSFGKGIEVTFTDDSIVSTDYPDRSQSITTYHFPSKGENPSWKITTSNKLPINETVNAIYVYADVNSENNLDILNPHIKVNFYDKHSQLVSSEILPADQLGIIKQYVKTPTGAVSVDIGLWSAITSYGYSIDWTKLLVSDISHEIEPISVTFTTKSDCVANCVLFARVLQSHKGGSVSVSVNDQEFTINTATNYNRFIWSEIGDIEASSKYTVNITNESGFNALNALVILNKNDYYEIRTKVFNSIDNSNTVLLINPQSALPTTNDNRGVFQGLSHSEYQVLIPQIIESDNFIPVAKDEGTFLPIDPKLDKSFNSNDYVITYEIPEVTEIATLNPLFIGEIPNRQTDISSPISISKKNPTLYSFSDQPTFPEGTFISLDKPYDPNWILRSNTSTYEPIELNGGITGWFLPQPDKITSIEYKPQKYFYYGVIISLLSVSSLCVYMYLQNKRNHISDMM
jgi:hypothetical protein